jgi:hypothetical protein
MKREFKNIVDDFEREAEIDAIGLWQLVSAVKIDMGEDKPERVKQFTFDLVRTLLSRGFSVGRLSKSGRELEPWPDQGPQAVIDRIDVAWRDLGRDPFVGDIAWFGRD